MPVLGGVATRDMLVRLTSRRALESALATGGLVRVNRGRYAVPGVHEGTELALMVTGHVCLVSAALAHGWKVKVVPAVPQVAVPKDRRINDALSDPHDADVDGPGRHEVEGLATNATTTLAMCGRRLPFDEALAVADSALRDGFPVARLRAMAAAARGPGSARLRRVAAHADGRSDNPFESVLRAIAIDVPGLEVEPQVRDYRRARPECPCGPGRSPPAGSSSRRTPSSGTETATPCGETHGATTSSSPTAGRCSASRGRTSCTTRTSSARCCRRPSYGPNRDRLSGPRGLGA